MKIVLKRSAQINKKLEVILHDMQIISQDTIKVQEEHSHLHKL